MKERPIIETLSEIAHDIWKDMIRGNYCEKLGVDCKYMLDGKCTAAVCGRSGCAIARFSAK